MIVPIDDQPIELYIVCHREPLHCTKIGAVHFQGGTFLFIADFLSIASFLSKAISKWTKVQELLYFKGIPEQ